jgi:hypothetical protein
LIRYLLTENGVPGLHFATTILLYDSQSNEETYNLLMKEEGIIHKLTADLMQGDAGSDNRLQEAVLRLLFEMTRVQRVDPQALGRCAEVTGWRTASTNWPHIFTVQIDYSFVAHLIGSLEQSSIDVNDPFRASVMQVLVNNLPT